jgi:hypothetical protein
VPAPPGAVQIGSAVLVALHCWLELQATQRPSEVQIGVSLWQPLGALVGVLLYTHSADMQVPTPLPMSPRGTQNLPLSQG